MCRLLYIRPVVKWFRLHGYTLALTLTSLYVFAFLFVPFIMEVLK